MITRLQSLSGGSLRSMVGYMGVNLLNDVARGVAAVMPTVSVSNAFVKLFQEIEYDPANARKLHEHLLPLLTFMMQSH